jgi:hypothetical protein
MVTVAPIFYNPASVILHKDNAPSSAGEKSNLLNYRKIGFANQWKALCGFRNYLYVMRTHGGRSWGWCLNFLFKTILKVALFEERGLELIKYYVRYWMQGVGLSSFKTIRPDEWKKLSS